MCFSELHADDSFELIEVFRGKHGAHIVEEVTGWKRLASPHAAFMLRISICMIYTSVEK